LEIDLDKLQKTLGEERILITYFDDVEIIQSDSFIPALQYLGSKGFFPTYKAKPEEALDSATARIWLQAASNMNYGNPTDPNRIATILADLESTRMKSNQSWKEFLNAADRIDSTFGKVLRLEGNRAAASRVTRGEACEAIYTALFAE